MKLFHWLLAVYPHRFREQFGAGMRAAFAEDYARARAGGRFAGLFFVTTTILRALCFGFVERFPRAVTIRSFVSVDVRDAIRSLWATPLVSAVAILSLALGIGANTALFSILNSLVLRQLPVREPHKLVMVGRTDWTNPIWEQLRLRQSELFESACAWSFQRFNLSDTGRADPVDGVYVSGGLFDTLGINMVAGRPLTPADDVRGGGPDGHVAVISHRFWQQRFSGARDVLERQLTLNRVRFRIVGVAPEGSTVPRLGRRWTFSCRSRPRPQFEGPSRRWTVDPVRGSRSWPGSGRTKVSKPPPQPSMRPVQQFATRPCHRSSTPNTARAI